MLSKYFYMTYTFIISDESVNADGFVIQTKGIRTERFKKNPVCSTCTHGKKAL